MKPILLLFSILILMSCKTQKPDKSNIQLETAQENTNLKQTINLIGTIQKQGVTTYQYGSHVLRSSESNFALRSEKINLDDFEGKTVRVIGEKIEGYPISGGPDFILVTFIEKIKAEDE